MPSGHGGVCGGTRVADGLASEQSVLREMRLPKRPVDPALEPGAPLTPSSNRVHPEVSPLAGSAGKPRRLPPLSDAPKLEPEPEPESHQRPEAGPRQTSTGTALDRGDAEGLNQRRIRGHDDDELWSAFQLFDIDGGGAFPASRCEQSPNTLATRERSLTCS